MSSETELGIEQTTKYQNASWIEETFNDKRKENFRRFYGSYSCGAFICLTCSGIG